MEDSTRIAASITFVFVDGSVVADKAEGNLSAKIARSAKSLGQSYRAQYYLKHLPLLLRTAANDHAGDHIIMTLMHGWMVWKGKVCTLDIFGTKQFVQVVAVTGHAHAEEEQQMDVDDTVVTYKIVDRLALIDKKEVEKKAHLYTHHIQFQPALIVHSPVSAVHASNDTSKGMQSVLYEISIRLSHRRMATSTMNVRYGTGVLLTGPSGCGKTHLLKQLGAHTSMPILFMNCTSLFETTNPKEAIHRITTDILEMARLEANGCVLVMDNLDAILPFKMNESDENQHGIYLAMMKFMNDISMCRKAMIIATAIAQRNVAPMALQSGYLDRHVMMPLPSVAERVTILRQMLPQRTSIGAEALKMVADEMHGFSPSDVVHVVREGMLLARARGDNAPSVHGSWPLEACDLMKALRKAQPSALQGFSVHVPDRSMQDLIGMQDVLDYLEEHVLYPCRHRETFREHGLPLPKGILLHGPSGCGKSHLAYALCHAIGFNVIFTEGTQLRSKVVGETEKNIAMLFERARASAPTIILIDQMETLVTSRTLSVASTSHGTSERIVTCFLTEMDGMSTTDTTHPIMVLGLTNQFHRLDEAVLRPGRLDHLLKLPVLDRAARVALLRHTLAPIQRDISPMTEGEWAALAAAMDGYTGADVQSVYREVALAHLRRVLDSKGMGATTDKKITYDDFMRALAQR